MYIIIHVYLHVYRVVPLDVKYYSIIYIINGPYCGVMKLTPHFRTYL